MRKQLYFLVAVVFGFYAISCNNKAENEKPLVASESKPLSQEELIKRGDYIVTTSGCADCHSPKVMTPMGPVADSTKMLSGHPANEPMPSMEASAGKPGGWIFMGPDVTSFVGPWGISYAANLTPDSATGTGLWTEEQFINTIRNGKHLGNGRDILPPMPWYVFRLKTDDDLKAIFAYLKSLPPISNRVPGPVTPPDLMKMASKK